MKKTYTAPAAEVILISSSDILMLSKIEGSDENSSTTVDWSEWETE